MKYYLTYLFMIVCSLNLLSQGANSSLFEYLNSQQVSLTLEQQEIRGKLNTLGSTFLVDVKDISLIGNDGIVEIITPVLQSPTFAFEVKNAHIDANNNLYWYGTLPVSSDSTNDLTGYLLFNIYNGKKFGILSIDTITYHLYDLGNNRNLLVKLDAVPLTPFMNCGVDLLPSDSSSNALIVKENETHLADERKIITREPSCNEVDVLVLATPNAIDHLGSEDIVFQTALNEIAWANQAFRNSNINENILKLNLVDFQVVNFVEETNGEIFDEAVRFKDNFEHLRDPVYADLVIGLTHGEYIRTTLDGLQLTTYGIVLEVGLSEGNAFCIAEVSSASLHHHIPTHEIGHLFACRHEPSGDDTDTFAKAHLFRRCFFCKRHRTVMHQLTLESFFQGNSRLIQHFSNPDVNYFPNRATGIEDKRDNARQLRDAACTVSQYRIDPLDLILDVGIHRSHECVAPSSKMLVTANADGGGSLTYEWRWSFDGINYSSVLSTNSSFLVTLQSFPHTLFVQVTVHSSDGQVETATIPILVDQHCPYIDESPALAQRSEETTVMLYPPQPNPTRGNFSVNIEVTEPQHVFLNLSDIHGNSIKTIYDGKLSNGLHTFEIEEVKGNEGLLYLNLRSKTDIQSQKVLFLE